MTRRAAMRAMSRVASILLLAALAPALAQSPPAADATAEAPARPGTGNAWIDARLRDMDGYAARYRDAFVDEIVRYHEAPRALVEDALADDAIPAGEVYFACALAQATGRACRTLVELRRAHPAADWKTLAERLDPAPDAGIYRRIRGDITESYVRWARPLGAVAAPRR